MLSPMKMMNVQRAKAWKKLWLVSLKILLRMKLRMIQYLWNQSRERKYL